jgi:hypothetical protein
MKTKGCFIASRAKSGVLFTTVAAFFGTACSAGNAPDDVLQTTSEPLTVPQKQAVMNTLYDMINVVTINVSMDPAQWDALRHEVPAGGVCNFDNSPNVDRFVWRPTTQIAISGTSYPSGTLTFTGVEIKKKSFCGSYTDGSVPDKPAFKLKFQSAAEDSIGTRYLTLNNSKQDPSYVRQCLGYLLYASAGLPHSRCNFARVIVNGSAVMDGIYVNVEPIRERYIDNPDNFFAHPNTGNLYEFELDDFDPNRVQYVDTESLSVYSNKNDLSIAASTVASGRSDQIELVMDGDEAVKVFAMEYLLKHWDGYGFNRNNTYVYNDVVAVSNPSSSPLDPNQIHFKLIPWGLDQILQSPDENPIALSRVPTTRNGLVRPLGLLSTQREDIWHQIATLREIVLSRARIEGAYKTYIDRMQEKLGSLGFNNTAEIDKVRRQLELARSVGFVNGFSSPTGYTTPETGGMYVIDKATGNAMHASNSETVSGPTPPAYEVVHQTRQDSGADRWLFNRVSAGNAGQFEIVNEAYGRYLHASGTWLTPQNHYFFYTTPTLDTLSSQDYFLFQEQRGDAPDNYGYTGYWILLNQRTQRYVRFGTDDFTPSSGRPRVHQDTTPSHFSFY